MGAHLDDPRAVEHDDEIGHPHGAEAMRHEDRDAAVRRRRAAAGLPLARGRRVALEQRVLGLGVERRRRLVEHQEQRTIAHEAAGQRELLPLAEADLHALGPGRAELRLEPGGEPRRPRRPRPPGRRPPPPPARRRAAARRPTPTVCRARNSKRKKS